MQDLLASSPASRFLQSGWCAQDPVSGLRNFCPIPCLENAPSSPTMPAIQGLQPPRQFPAHACATPCALFLKKRPLNLENFEKTEITDCFKTIIKEQAQLLICRSANPSSFP